MTPQTHECVFCNGSGIDFSVRRTGPAPPRGPGITLTGQGACFVGAGLMMLAIRLLGALGDAVLLPAALFLLGLIGLVKGSRESVGATVPRLLLDRLGRLPARALWLFRPRAWMVAWAVILVCMFVFGTPHLRITYSARKDACTYFGLNGYVERRFPTRPCELVEWLPFAFRSSRG